MISSETLLWSGNGVAKQDGRTYYNEVHHKLQGQPFRQYNVGDVVALAGHSDCEKWIVQVLDFFSTDKGTDNMMMPLWWFNTRNQVLDPTHVDEWEKGQLRMGS